MFLVFLTYMWTTPERSAATAFLPRFLLFLNSIAGIFLSATLSSWETARRSSHKQRLYLLRQHTIDSL